MSYETPEQTNARLYRPILDGKIYESLIPKSSCKRIDGGKGNTEYSVNQMNEVVRLYSKQTTSTAHRLKKGSLKQTVQAIQDFLYWHFQYKRDLEDQLLRSPACSFAQRFDGIDCKSYSIIGASILHELGIKSYFRRVSYKKGQPYGHVYIVVPKNQKTADLSDDDYVIDGTLNINVGNEPPFYENSDLLVMDKMNHYILNAPAPQRGLGNPSRLSGYDIMYLHQRGISPYQVGLGNDSKGDSSWFSDFFKNINFKSLFSGIKNLINQLKCGSYSFKPDILEANLNTIVNALKADIKAMNDFLEQKNYTEFSRKAREILLKYPFVRSISRATKPEWQGCSQNSFDQQTKFLENNIGVVLKALRAWLDSNFNHTQESYVIEFNKEKSAGDFVLGGTPMRFTNTKNQVLNAKETDAVLPGYIPNLLYAKFAQAVFSAKPNKVIPFFEPTPGLEDAIKSGNSNFNTQSFLNDLIGIGTVFQGSASPYPTPGGGQTYQNTGGNSYQPQPGGTTKQAGFNSVAGILLLAGAAGAAIYGFNKTPEKPKKQ